MSTSILSKKSFNERTFEIVYKLKNNDEFKTFNLIKTDSIEYASIDEKFARKICEKL